MAKKKTARKPAKKSAPARTRTKAKAAPPVKTARFRVYQIDAFTRRRFHGNPASVVLLDKDWLPDQTMQAIAAEHNLSETVFIRRAGKNLGIRWFAPNVEVSLCGHGTLAAAYVLWNLEKHKGAITFDSQSGKLPVTCRTDGMLVLDFPSRPGKKITVSNKLCEALGHEPTEAYEAAGKIMAVFDNRRAVYDMQPDFNKVAAIDAEGIIVTAPGSGHDFVTRFFAPRHGVNEDPVTGSSHCTLVPYWSARLGRKTLASHQTSARGGELFCEDKGKRILIGGFAVAFSKGEITVERD